MAATIKTKIRTTTGGTPSTTAGELCVNTYDKKIFIGDGAASVELANQIGYNTITTLGTISTGTWSATAIGATKGGTGQTTYATGDLIYSSASDTLSKLTKPAATSVLSMTSAGVPSWNAITGTGNTVFGTSPSISTLEISTTTSGNNKFANINMATGVTATRLVSSTITLNAYSSDYPNVPAVPFTKTGYITCDSSYDLKLGTGYDSFISFDGNGISIGDVAGANGGGVITVDGPDSGYISLVATNITLGGSEDIALLGISGDGLTIEIGDIQAYNDSVMISVNIQTNIIAFTNANYVNIETSYLKLATTTPAVGKVLTCMDGDGTVSWETPSGGSGSGTPDYVLFNLGII